MSLNIKQRLFALSRIPQTNYQTPTVAAAGPPKSHIKLIATDNNLADYSVETQDNANYATGSDFPTDQWSLSHDVSMQKSVEVCSQEIGRLLLLAFGSVITSQPDAGGAPLVYKHVFKPQDESVSRQLPSTSYIEQLTSAHDVQYPSAVMEKLSIKGDGKGRLTTDFNLRGSGKRTVPSGVTWATHVDQLTSALNYFFNSQMALNVNDGASLDYLCRYDSFMFDVDNALLAEEGFRPGCALFQTSGDTTTGMIRGECEFGQRKYSSDFVVRLASGGAEYAALQQQKNVNVTVTCTGGLIQTTYYHKLIFKIPLTRYETVQLGESNSVVTLQIKPKPLWDVAAGKIVEVELFNNVASYAT